MLFSSFPSLFAQTVEGDLRPRPQEELERYESQLKESLEEAEGEIEGEDPSGRYEWFMFQRRFPYSTIPTEMRTKAIRETVAFSERLAQSTANGKGASVQADPARWENIGPRNIAGRVRAIALHPTKPGTLFIGAAAGGVWQNTGNFNQWTTTFDGQSALAIGAIEIDPNNPDVIYVGTGEVINSHGSQFNGTPSYFGDGMFKSTDGGATWFNSGLSQLGTISDIHVRKDNSNIVYATSAQGGGGFYISYDAGANWKKLRDGTFFSIAVNSLNEDEVLLAEVISLSNSPRIVYTKNATALSPTFSIADGIVASRVTRSCVAQSASNPMIAYAMVSQRNESANSGRDSSLVFKSVDGGVTWTLKKDFGGNFFATQGHYNQNIIVHPTNPDIVLVAGIDVFRTSDGGDTWTNTTRSYTNGNVHPDQHTFAFDLNDPNIVYLGNDGGVYRSTNTGLNWTRISLSLPITQFYEMGLDQTRPYRAFGGAQDNGSMVALESGKWADNWVSILGGDGFHTIADEQEPNIVYAESQYGRLSLIDLSDPASPSSFYLTSDLDRSSSSDYDPGAWSTPIAMSPVDKRSLYTARTDLWRSLDFGGSWSKLDPGSSSKISAIGLSWFDNLDIVIGTSSGEVRYSTDGGFEWGSASGIPGRYISEILFDPVEANRVYVVASGFGSGHVFRSDDNGKTFTNITSNLPDIPTTAFAVDPENNNILFVGNDVGVFISLDGGQFWLPFNNGLPFVPISDMEIHRSKRTLVAATHGRSMFEISIDNPQPPPAIIQPNGGQIFQSDDTIDIAWVGFEGPVRVLISYDGGRTFDTLAVLNTGSTYEHLVPFIRTTNAIIRIETLDGVKYVDSDAFSLTPAPNIDSRGKRGFLAGAIAIRDRDLWAVNKESEDILALRLPSLIPTGDKFSRSNIPGTIVDMAYDEENGNDRFFILTADLTDFSGAKLYQIDPDGTNLIEIPLPESTMSGVTVTPSGVTVVSPGVSGRAYVIDPSNSGQVISSTDPLQNGTGDRRVGLAWNGSTLAQGVENAQPGTTLPDALQHLNFVQQLSVRDEVPLVVEDNKTIDMYGLVFYPNSGSTDVGFYYITGTDGEFYILETALTSSVSSGALRQVKSSISFAQISPNPFSSVAEITVELASSGQVRLDLFDVDGRLIATPFNSRMELGSNTITFEAKTLPSGLYTFVLTGPNGDRDIKPAVLMR
ncbi:MAG: hypothetical protein AB7H80_05605 [Candidatus Kapaibacterium sp.]